MDIKYFPVVTFLIVSIFFLSGCSRTETDYSTWQVRGGNKEQNRYSSLEQIDTSNVGSLEVAWIYHTKDKGDNTQIQSNAILKDDVLFSTSPKMKVIALHAASGKEKWMFDPFKGSEEVPSFNINRGVSYWENHEESRILFTAGSFLYALDAQTGRLVKSFGKEGRVSLKEGFSERYKNHYAVATSPGIIYNDLIIIGSRVSEGSDAAPGDIKAFNVKSGNLEWTFHTIPHPGEYGYDTWEDGDAWQKIGGANSWAGMALDEERAIVYVPTGSASPDFYGGNRKGQNLFANSLVALNAETGERIWHYQVVHHDLWDRDLPSPPTLLTVENEGETIDAVAQTTKTGFIYLFNRETGEPIFEINEVPVPNESGLEGEEVWPTQPIPSKPEALIRQEMGVNDVNPYISKPEQQEIQQQIKELQKEHMFEPPALKARLMFPGFDGGSEWGGNAYDPKTGLLYVNTNEVPWILKMIKKEPDEGERTMAGSLKIGSHFYKNNCAACHGMDRSGSGRSPSLLGVEDRISPEEIMRVVNNGKGMMPAFSQVSDVQKQAVVNYLINDTYYNINAANTELDKKEVAGSNTAGYSLDGYRKFRTEEGYPAVSPPWGTLNAVDLNSGNIVWQVPLGEYPDLKEKNIPATGTENYGGPVVTKGGLIFIAATLDKKIRAYNKVTGELLWEAELPFAGFATPSTYQVDGKQYIVIACGGGKLGVESGDAYVAFALPD